MEDSFKVRVDKIFGSLNSSSSSSSSSATSLSSLWCLTDDEIERREWNRDKAIPELEPSFLANHGDGSVKDHQSEVEDLQDLDDEDGDLQGRGSSSRSAKPDDYNDEEWEIKSSIGLDCTLDYEEEEDEYDKVAVGKEKPGDGDGDGVYMRDIGEYGIDIDSGNELPTSFKDVIKDPRANHLAAKIRLKEDAEAAKKVKVDSLDTETNASDDAHFNPKSILKRKDNQLDSKCFHNHKRVRFDPHCKDNYNNNNNNSSDTEAASASGVPDYLSNPSRYTHYTFDSSSTDLNEDTNKQAYMDLLKALNNNKSNASIDDSSNANANVPDASRSVTFIPRKKINDTTTKAMVDSCTELVQQVGIDNRRSMIGGIAAVDTDASAMEEDEAIDYERSKSHKAGRQYRIKPRSDSQLDLEE